MNVLEASLGAVLAAAAAGCAYLLAERRGLRRTLVEREAELARLAGQLASAGEHAARLGEEAAGLRARTESLAQRLDEEPRRLEERLNQQRVEMTERFESTFAALAAAALDKSQERLIRLAEQNLGKHHEKAEADLAARVRAVDALVKPVQERLAETGARLEAMDKSRAGTEAAVKAHVDTLAAATRGVQTEAARLVQALRSPQVRGRWGEATLRRTVELSGMSEHCDFSTQVVVGEGADAQRPDMVVRLPGDRIIVVDAKCTMSAYLDSINATTDEQRAERDAAHARHVREHIDALANKTYQAQFDRTPDFTVMFIPAEQMLLAALRVEPDLIERAAARNVILTTPATLIALLKAVSFGWAQVALAEEARAVIDAGRELHDRIASMTAYLARMGKALRVAVDAYNELQGNVERRVAPAARQIGAMRNARTRKELIEAPAINDNPRLPAGSDAGSLSVSGGFTAGDEPEVRIVPGTALRPRAGEDEPR